MLLVGAKFVGDANAVLPVILEAKKDSVLSALYVDASGPLADSFAFRYPQYFSVVSALVKSDFSPENILDWLKPKAVLVSAMFVYQSDANNNLVKGARQRDIKTIAVEDFWATHRYLRSDARPDIICVQDELGKKLVLNSWEHYPAKNVVVSGQPAFDYLSATDCRPAREELKKLFNLTEDWPIVHFSGGVDEMPEAVQITIDALNRVGKPVYFFLRHHPILLSSTANDKQKEIYRAYKDMPSQLNKGLSVDSSKLNSSNLVNAAADIVIGQFGTMLIEACYLGKPCAAIWTPATQNIFFTTGTDGLLDEFPPCTLGACLRVANTEELASGLDSIVNDASGLKDDLLSNQRKHFKTDGRSAQRVYDAITHFQI